ncbi:MAG TPA: hypothetical protein VHV83_02640, partial [Armatimonadota bacterium]|nr:hypothetical protein [Armatimonadota bacterium]
MSSHQHEILVTDGSLGLTVQQIAETFLGVSPTLDDLFATTLKSLYSSHGDDAIAHCNALITETPKDPEPLIVCAALLQAMGDPQQAITAYRKAIALKPPYVDQVCRQLDALIDAMHEQLSAETPADGDSTPQVTFKSAEQPLTDDDLADDVQARP